MRSERVGRKVDHHARGHRQLAGPHRDATASCSTVEPVGIGKPDGDAGRCRPSAADQRQRSASARLPGSSVTLLGQGGVAGRKVAGRRRPTACSRRPAHRCWRCRAACSRASPGARKRGRLAVSTIGSRTITSPLAWPTASLVQATAITRTVPLNCGMSKSTVALPSASSFDDAGEEGDQLFGRRAALRGHGAAVAAGAQPARAPSEPSIRRP